MTASLTLQESADLLGVHYMTVYKYVRTGRLPATKVGRAWHVDPNDLALLDGDVTPRADAGRVDRTPRLIRRMLAGDEAGAWTIVEQALASGMTSEDIYLDLLAPALRRIGDGWERGELSVADEHRASAVALRLIGRHGPRFRPRGPRRAKVVVGAAPGEMHVVPGAIVADLLRADGFEVVDLGGDVPAESFAEAAQDADACAIGATVTGSDDALSAAVAAVRARRRDLPILVGGAAVRDSEHAAALGAAWTGTRGTDAVRAVARAVA